MPLNPGNPVRVTRPFERLDHSIGSTRGYAKIAPRLEHRLVMRTVYARVIFSSQLRQSRQSRSRFDLYKMKWLRSALLTRPSMLDFGSYFTGDILDQRS